MRNRDYRGPIDIPAMMCIGAACVASIAVFLGLVWGATWGINRLMGDDGDAATATPAPTSDRAGWPKEFSAYMPGDPLYEGLELKPGALQVRPPEMGWFVPGAYGGSYQPMVDSCMLSSRGMLTLLRINDEPLGGDIEGVVALYKASPDRLEGTRECASWLVGVVPPTWFFRPV